MSVVLVAVASVAATGGGIVWWRFGWLRIEHRRAVVVAAVRACEVAYLQELFGRDAYVPESDRR